MSECTPDEFELSRTVGSHFHCLTRGQTVGLALRLETGFISLTAILTVYVLIIRNVYRHWRRDPHGDWRLLDGPADIYMLALFTYDLFQSVGRTLDIKWVQEGKVYTGPYCNAVGGIQQFGETGSAQVTLAIAVHTFVAVWFGKGRNARLVAALIVLVTCVYTALFVGIGIAKNGDKGNPYIAPSPYWCWINPDDGFLVERITGEYLWLWITLFVSCLLYVPMFFLTRGNITLDKEHWWRFKSHPPKEGYVASSIGMLAYPIVYALTILPLSVVRWYGFTHHVPTAATFAVSSLYGLNGLFNVLLLFARPDVLLFGAPQANTRARRRRRRQASSGAPVLPASRSPSPVAEGTPGMKEVKRRGALPDDSSDEEQETRPAGGFGVNRGYVDEEGGVHHPPSASFERLADPEVLGGLPRVSPSLRERPVSEYNPSHAYGGPPPAGTERLRTPPGPHAHGSTERLPLRRTGSRMSGVNS